MVTSANDVHVLHVVRTLGRSGGMERNLYRVIKTLTERGLRHSIALLSDFEDIIDFSGLAEVKRIVTPPNDPRLVWMLRQHIQQVRPTVVHARNWGAWPDAALARLSMWPRPAMVFSYHGAEDSEPPPLKRKLAFQALTASSDRMFAVSAAARDLIQGQYGVGFKNIEVIPNGVNTDLFFPREGARPDGPLRIGAAGRLHPIKNFPLILEAVALLPESLGDVRVRFAGEGPERDDMLNTARRLGIESRVEFAGHVDDVPAFLRGLDAFVLSSDNEANPNALLEAMASGLPCISTAVGGAVEVSRNGVAARLVPARDPKAMASALSALLQDSAARTALGGSARDWILQNYGQSGMMAKYEDLYRAPRSP